MSLVISSPWFTHTNWQETLCFRVCTEVMLMDPAHPVLPAWLVSLLALNWQRSADGATFIKMTGVWRSSLCSMIIIWHLSYPVHELVIWTLRWDGIKGPAFATLPRAESLPCCEKYTDNTKALGDLSGKRKWSCFCPFEGIMAKAANVLPLLWEVYSFASC